LLHHPQLFGSKKGDVFSFDPGVVLITPGSSMFISTKRANDYFIIIQYYPDVGVLEVISSRKIHQPEQLLCQLAAIILEFHCSHNLAFLKLLLFQLVITKINHPTQYTKFLYNYFRIKVRNLNIINKNSAFWTDYVHTLVANYLVINIVELFS
jgi:hypothetical protein